MADWLPLEITLATRETVQSKVFTRPKDYS